ncbi:hypothetical protein Tco_0342053 [Tanacetum coccineum]
MEEMLIISGTEGRLEIWAAELRTYDVSCILRKEVEGQVVRKFFKQGEKVQRALDKNGEETSKMFQNQTRPNIKLE